MKTVKKLYGKLVSYLLLLIFIVAIVPFDLLHTHVDSRQVCNDVTEKGYCNHKLHLSEKTKSCFGCAVHFNKTFEAPSLSEKLTSFPAVNILVENKVIGNFARLIIITLRGPPAE